jgi:putative flippase GtrA
MSAIDQTSAAVAGGAYDIPATASGGASALFQRVRRLLRYTGVNLVTVTLDYAIFLSLTHLSHKSANRLMAEFLATGILGLVLTAGITGLSVHYLHLSPILSKTIAVLICFVALYVVRSRLVFKAQA